MRISIGEPMAGSSNLSIVYLHILLPTHRLSITVHQGFRASQSSTLSCG